MDAGNHQAGQERGFFPGVYSFRTGRQGRGCLDGEGLASLDPPICFEGFGHLLYLSRSKARQGLPVSTRCAPNSQ